MEPDEYLELLDMQFSGPDSNAREIDLLCHMYQLLTIAVQWYYIELVERGKAERRDESSEIIFNLEARSEILNSL